LNNFIFGDFKIDILQHFINTNILLILGLLKY